MAYSLGIDFGTSSVRAVIVGCEDGSEMGTGVTPYPSGHQGVLLDVRDDKLARQNPADYFHALEASVKGALADARKNPAFTAKKITGIGVDSTGSSPLPVDARNRPLAFDKKWQDNLSAQCWLWKDHTSYREAAEITRLAAEHRPHYIAKCGQTYSSEWWWSKIWHCLKTAPEVFDAAASWVELCDYIPAVLSGVSDPTQIKRSICAAGHKALYSDEWGGLPDREFLSLLHPKLASLRDRLYEKAEDASHAAGTLGLEWSDRLGLEPGIPIAMGAFDVHYGAIGSGVEEGVLVKVIGTSTCDCAVVSTRTPMADIPGICGIVPGSILPGYYGIEAGQSAVGDIFNWFVEKICEGDGDLHAELVEQVKAQRPGRAGLLALDWNNGNRTVLVDPLLSGLLLGQSLQTTRAEIYRALVESTAYGARAIIERLKENGVPVKRVICCGGIAEKNPFLMQIYADVLGCEIRIAGSSQACALGAALSASVLAGKARGGHDGFPEAQRRMTSAKDLVYVPNPENQATYNELYSLYRELHDAFGGVDRAVDLSKVMKKLIHIKETQI